MKRHFDEDLDDLRGRLLRMGALAERMIRYAMKLLVERDESHMAEVRDCERQVNLLHIEIDERCLALIALHQPAAGDLRLIAAAVKINADLERIGDQAVNVAETATYLCGMSGVRLGDITRMEEISVSMLKDSLDAFARKDLALAQAVLDRDDEVDGLKKKVFDETAALMRSDPSAVQTGIETLLISRNFERIADHSTNIAEDVIFMVAAKDIRHGAGRSPEPSPG